VLIQPLATIPDEQVIRLVLNWLSKYAKNGYQVTLRIPVPEEQKVYNNNNNSCIYKAPKSDMSL